MIEENKLLAVKIDMDQYSKLVKQTMVFQMPEFLELNRNKVDELIYLSINKNDSARFAVYFGIKDGIAKCPFSSPCGYPISLKKDFSIRYFNEALNAIDLFAKENGWKEIKYILPPLSYAKGELTAWINAMYCNSYIIENIDVNFAFDLKKVYVENYEKIIQRNARKNLRIAMSSGLELYECVENTDIHEAYEVISENRAAKGYPLRMTLEQVMATIDVVKHNVFLVKKDGVSIAAALVYVITDDMAQVIYWGDKPGYSELKPINFLSYNLIRYYGEKGFQCLDIGISTVDSEPNYGLCEFKESIGCERDLKITMIKKVD